MQILLVLHGQDMCASFALQVQAVRKAGEENWPGVGPRLFATLDGQVGLIPYIAQKNDMLFQFQGSDVVAVVRVEGQHQLKIIGRAVLANDTYVEIQKS